MNIKKNILKLVISSAALLLFCIPIGVSAAEPDYSNLVVSPAEKPSIGGSLQILQQQDGTKTLCDKGRKPIQLRGMNTHGLQWFPAILNNNAFAAVSNDWGANVIRLDIYVTENGYDTDPEGMTAKVIKAIDLSIANNMYVIVDWHINIPGDPNASVYSGAKDFFKKISSKYPNNPNIIYELCNEPSNVDPGISDDSDGWKKVKSYAEPIIKMLRETGNNNLVICGTPSWSHRPDLAADDPIVDSANNTIYSAHFSAGSEDPSPKDATDRTNVVNSIKYALKHGVAVFASEWTPAEATGLIEKGGIYKDSSDCWLNFLNKNNISWCSWSLANNNDASAAFIPYEMGKSKETSLDPGDDQVWSPYELTIAGEYDRARIKGINYEPIDRTKQPFTTTLFDFNNGNTEGFGVNRDSQVKTVGLSNENSALKISGLNKSSNLSIDNFWGNARISTEASNLHEDIKDADSLTMDVITASPTTVSIAAVPQSNTHSWADPKKAVQLLPQDFKLQKDGSYKATLTISSEDCPNIKNISSDPNDSVLTDMVLFIGASTDSISLDNISFSGFHSIDNKPVVNAPVGKGILPSTFEDSTRNGWDWDPSSGVSSQLNLEEANNSKAMSFYVQYPEKKPTDEWTASPRLTLSEINATRGDNNYFTFDLYLKPDVATKGTISFYLAFIPPELGYWALASEQFNVELANLSQAEKTPDGLYHFKVKFDLNKIDDEKVIAPDTILRDITIVAYDKGCDFAGKMYIDNIGFEK
ncbi:carbohydrate-binding domain-containing protein [Clostridium felsineum]|uniref:cellulase n=1 Tax=Clostridium felsineum TaxID=36839 RepID=A0A1S8LR11_9CLOT|nr:carbohydrate-binding domain-containing protein [Clostridium felsineum]URZ05573.1 Endoglucanase [Clostridium felsineum]URZ10612.1 Endoglucanase [Clostridium felsineum]